MTPTFPAPLLSLIAAEAARCRDAEVGDKYPAYEAFKVRAWLATDTADEYEAAVKLFAEAAGI